MLVSKLSFSLHAGKQLKHAYMLVSKREHADMLVSKLEQAGLA